MQIKQKFDSKSSQKSDDGPSINSEAKFLSNLKDQDGYEVDIERFLIFKGVTILPFATKHVQNVLKNVQLIPDYNKFATEFQILTEMDDMNS